MLTTLISDLLVESIEGLIQNGLMNTFEEDNQKVLLLAFQGTFIDTRDIVRRISH